MMAFTAQQLCYRAGGRTLIDGVDLELRPGEVHALLGPNGSGKSTLLRLLAGELKSESGDIQLNGKALSQWTALEQARQRAVLSQNHALDFPFTATEVVALGRLSATRRNVSDEREIIEQALNLVDAQALATHLYPTLSGGERARIQLARVLVQIWEPTPQPRYVLLDEPTAHLDLKHQHLCLHSVRRFVQQDVGALIVLHDLNLALQYADRVTLLNEGRVVASDTSSTVLTPDHIRQVYGVNSIALPGESQRPWLAVSGL